MPPAKHTETEAIAKLILQSYGADASLVIIMDAGELGPSVGIARCRIGLALRKHADGSGPAKLRLLADVLRNTAAGMDADALELELGRV